MSKVAVVTGGAKGIGAAISSLLAQNGYTVVINYNTSVKQADCLSIDLKSQGYTVDKFNANISNIAEAEQLIEFAVKKYNKIDLLVNNAGIAEQKLLIDLNDDDWSKMISTNLSSCFNCSRIALKYMVKQHSGNIINISSIWGITGSACEAHYSAAKAGVIGLTKSLAKEYGPSGIRVNCVAPGVIKTDMLNSFTEEDLKNLADNTPLCRLGNPSDVANAVLFLASDNASFITGQTLNVDGGFIV